MYNPLVRLSERILIGLHKQGNKYFVRQYYHRGIGGENGFKIAFLFSFYTDLSKAQIHYDAIATDKYRFLYNTEDSDHMKRLEIAALSGHKFGIYLPILANQWKPDAYASEKIKHYVINKLGWGSRGYTRVQADLIIQFGELFLVLRLSIHEVKIPLSELQI
jgi:hypothetical protein